MNENQTINSDMSIGTLLLMVFIILKLCHVIAWSWLWVLAPLWVPWALWTVIMLACGLFCLVVSMFED